VKCYRTEKSVPFAPITTLIRQLSRLPGFVALDPVWIGELTRLVPELRERFPGAPQPMAVDDAARHRLSDATASAALSVADEEPLMIVIDDLHDSDEASLALLHYLCRQTPSAPILVIGNLRTGTDWSDFERTFFQTARTAGFCVTMQVQGLPPSSTARLIEQVLAHKGLPSNERLVERLSLASRGNPLAALEATLAWERHHVSSGTKADDETASNTQQQLFLESAVSRLKALDAKARLVSGAIAIAGRPLSEYELGQITLLKGEEIAAALAALEGARFTRRFGSTVSLAHERYLAAVEEIQAGDAEALHLRTAQLLVNSAESNPALHYEAAKHFVQSGHMDAAKEQAERALAFASSMGAIRAKADAIELLRSIGTPLADDQLHELFSSYLMLNDVGRISHLHASRGQASEARQFDYYRIAADYQNGLAGFESTEAALESYLSDIEETDRPWKDASILLMRIADKTGRYSRVRQIAKTLRKKGQSSHALFAAAYVFLKYYGARRGLAVVKQALDASCEEGEYEIEQASRDAMGVLLKQVGQYKASIQQFDFSLGLARKTMNPLAEVACLNNRGCSQLCLGKWDDVRQTHAEADKVGADFSGWGFHLFRTYNMALVDLYQGELDNASRGFQSCFESSMRAGFLTMARESRAGTALIHQRMGQWGHLHDIALEIGKLLEGAESGVGWIDHAVLAYDLGINKQRIEDASAYLVSQERRLSRRDVSLEVALAREHVAMLRIGGSREADKRLAGLTQRVQALDALWVVHSIMP
jgi:hypothetical protein